MTIFYFTATGNSLAFAKKIGGTLVSIPQVADSRNYKDDAIGFVFPVFSFGLPNIVAEFVRGNSFESAYIFAVATCGMMCGGALSEIDALLGGRLSYGAKLKSVENFIAVSDKSIKRYNAVAGNAVADKILADISAQKRKKYPKGLFFLRGIHKNFSAQYKSADNDFIISENCDKCGICEKVCPKGNIKDNHFSHNCEFCFACIHACPQNAINYKQSTQNKLRYRNPEITIDEIIKSNNKNY